MLVKVGGREIGIFNVGGSIFAVSNRCPHEGASLCKGRVVGLVESSEPGPISSAGAAKCCAALARLGSST
jgi:hypothetical protein